MKQRLQRFLLLLSAALVSAVTCMPAVHAAIDLTLDVQALGADANTTSKQVNLQRVELAFANGRGSITVPRDSKGLYAIATLKYVGNGALSVRWKVDGRVISQYSKIFTFGQAVEFRSDHTGVALPSFDPGYHRVSVELFNTQGQVASSTRAIRYFVSKGVGDATTAESIRLMYPSDMSVDASRPFHFRWKGLKTIEVYQIEVESIADKVHGARRILSAFSKLDVYKPSLAQRADFRQGRYRWRVKGMFRQKKAPQLSAWHEFSVEGSRVDGGVFISSVQTQDNAGLSAGSRRTSVNVSTIASPRQNWLKHSAQILKRQSVTAGQPFNLQLQIENSSLKNSDRLQLQVSKDGQIMATYPVAVGAGQQIQVDVPLQSGPALQASTSLLDIQLVAAGKFIDDAQINLTEIPRLRLDALDFQQINPAGHASISVDNPFGCSNRPPPLSAALSRMVSARDGSSNQTLLQQGFFQFDQGQRISFTAYFEDQGLSEWFRQSVLACDAKLLLPGQRSELENNLQTLGNVISVCRNQSPKDWRKKCAGQISQAKEIVQQLRRDDLLQGKRLPLQFIAQPLDSHGGIDGAPIEIGEVLFDRDQAGLIDSPQWTIPRSGQYQISLSGYGLPADLYATRTGGLPLYLDAGGFELELETLSSGSHITSLVPRQALLSGRASSTWRGDTSGQLLEFDLENIAVSLRDPLHAVLNAGTVNLATSTRPLLLLLGETLRLRSLALTAEAAIADLSYVLPADFVQHNDQRNTIHALSVQSISQSAASASNVPGNILLNQVDIFNGGEFIARYPFDAVWGDVAFKQGDLALRLRGGELLIDASPHLNYDDYQQPAGFTGMGLRNVILRARVNAANHLPAVLNSDNAFLYGKASWLDFGVDGLSGENIALRPSEAVANFFGEKADSEWLLRQPFGFTLKVNGGVFSLQNSTIGGLDLAGYFSIPDSVVSALVASSEIGFTHLVRRRSPLTQQVFTTEMIQSPELKLDNGVFRYQPARMKLLIGVAEEREPGAPPAPNFDWIASADQQGLNRWLDAYSDHIVRYRSGLLLQQGELDLGWRDNNSNADVTDTRVAAFLLDSAGLSGYWLSGLNTRHYQVNGFDTQVDAMLLQFEQSALVNSQISGRLHIPYPVQQSLIFNGRLDQEASLMIAGNGLRFNESTLAQGALELPYWHARLNLPASLIQSQFRAGPAGGTIADLTQRVNITPALVFDAENQRVMLNGFTLDLLVDEALGGAEIIAANQAAPFNISSAILPNGQLADTRISATGDLFFIGQSFTPMGEQPVQFLPYSGTGVAPDGAGRATAEPLISVTGDINFSVFGPHEVSISHTALGARVSRIEKKHVGNIERAVGENIQDNWNTVPIKVAVDLRFVNTYGLFENGSTGLTGDDDNALPPAHYKAFVGSADLTLIDALSIKGLAEAGLHAQQSMRSGRADIGQNGIWAQPSSDIKAYERIGLGAGADTLKAVIAGVRGLETATRIGEAMVTESLGITGAGEKVVDLGLEAVTFIESIGMAVATNIPPASAPSEIVHAVDNGLATTNSAIELLKFLCEEQGSDSDCRRNDVPLFLDILSLLTRSTSAVLHVEDLATNPKEGASLSLQMLDVAIPVLQGEALENAAKNVGLDVSLQIPDENLNSMKNAVLTSAHVVVGAARRLVDQDMQLNFRDIVAISRRSVSAMQKISEIPVLRSELGENASLMNLSVTLADESITLIEDLQRNPDIARLQRVAADYFKLLCLHSEQVEPLLRQAGLQQVSQQILKPSLGLSAAVLDDLNRQGLPQHKEQIISRFLVSLLNQLAQGVISVEGCQSNTLAAQLPLLKPVFRMAAHSLLPLTGELQNEGELIAWALDGVKLSMQASDRFAETLGIAMPIQADELGALLQKLSDTFATSSLDLSDADSQQQAEAVLTLAGQLPQAFRSYIATASREAAELLDLYSVLMQDLLLLMQKPANERSVADAITLPISLINETQDLSLLNQQQKFALSNLAQLLFISREITRPEPSLRAINDHLQTLYGNIVALDQSGTLTQLDVAPIFAMMDILAEVSLDPQQTLARFNQYLAQLLPLIVGNSAQLLEPVQAVVAALPIVDFTQDDLTPTLDATLLRLLNDAETKTANPDTDRAIRKARSIISHADLPMSGLFLINDEQGNIIGARETRPDGSYREVQFPIGGAKQFFPPGHPDQIGGLDEVLLNVLDGEWSQLAPADQASLFSDYWNNLFASAQSSHVVTRKYRDADNNLIETKAVDLGTTYAVKVTSAVNAGVHQPYQIFISDEAPAIGSSMDNVVIQSRSLLEAGYALPFTSTALPTFCEFGGGCFVSYLQMGAVKIQPLHRKDFYALYIANENAANIQDISVIGLQQFNGRISADVAGWNAGWKVDFITGLERATLQSSSGSFDLLQLDVIDSVDSLAAMARLIMGNVSNLKQRVTIDGDDSWNYIIGEHATHRNRASGDWALYDMPGELPAGLHIPAPDETIPLDILTLQIKGGHDGVTDDPANLQGQISAGVLSLPVENSDEQILIPVSGDAAGEVITNGVPSTLSDDLAEAGIDPAQLESSDSRSTDAGAETPMQGTRVEATDGSTASVTSSDNGRLKMLRVAQPDHRRSVTIEFCMQNQALANCPAQDKKTYRFEYQWGQGPAGEISFLDFDFSHRPTITPASGTNQAIKHQLWLEIFNLENELFSDPSSALLDQLDALIEHGRSLALPEDELQAVKKYITARVINRLLDMAMKKYEANVDDPAKLAYWRQYPQQSPEKAIGDLLKRAQDLGIGYDNQLKVWEQETLRLQVVIDLMEIQRAIDNPELSLHAKLSATHELSSRLLDRMATQQLNNDENVQLNDACEYLQPLNEFVQQQILSNSNFIPSNDDLRPIIDLEAGNASLGCQSRNGSNLAELSALAMNLSMGANVESSSELLHSAVGLDKLLFAIKNPLSPQNAFIFYLAQVEFNETSQLYNPDADDVISIFIQQVLQQQNDNHNTPDPALISAPALEKVDEWMDYYFAIDTIERMMLQEKNRRQVENKTIYFYPGSAGQRKLQPLRGIMLDRLKQALIQAYQQRVDDFILAGETAELEKIDAIVTLREKIVSINRRIASERNPLIELDGLILRDAGSATPDVLASIRNQQQQWFDQQFWRQTGSDSFIGIWEKLNVQNEVLLYLKNTLPENLKSSVPDYYNPRVSQKLVADMQAVSQALAQAQTQAAVDAAVIPLVEIDQFLKATGFDDVYADFKQRGEVLIAEAIERIKIQPQTVEIEISKIVAIRHRLNGAGATDSVTAQTYASNEVAAALDAAEQSLQAQISQTTDLAIAKPLIAKIGAINVSRSMLGLDTSFAEIVSLLEPFRARMEQQLEQTKDLDKIAPYLDLLASMQLMGASSVEVFNYDTIYEVIAYQRDAVLQCRSNNSCTITHVRRALELEAGLAALGGNEDSSALAEITAMIESQSVAMKRSLRLDQEMPDVQALVYQDKTGHRGRLAAAITLQRLGNSLTVNDEAGRIAVASVIRRLRQLAQMSLPAGSVKPQPADDPLINSANELQQRIDVEIARLQEGLETILLSTTLTPDNISAVAQQLGTSEQEVTETLLPAANGSDQIVRIVPGNKYRLAAAELAGHQPTQEPWLALSYRLLNNLPDPAITTEGDYRLAAASQLAIYLLNQSSATLSASAADLTDTRQGRLLVGLMTLPAQPQLASGMVALLKDDVLAPMLSGESGFDCATSDIPCTLFDGGLTALGIVLDDLIEHTAGTPADGNGVDQTRILTLLQDISSALASDESWLGYAGQGLSIGLTLVTDPASAQTSVAADGLALINGMLQSSAVTGFVSLLPQPAPLGFNLISQSSAFIETSLSRSGNVNLPVALAGIAANALDDSLRPVSVPLADFTREINQWSLGFADEHWSMVTDSLQRDNAEDWLLALNGNGGIGSLTCRINQLHLLGEIQMPPALALTPFTTAQSLYSNRSKLRQTDQSPKVLADLAADLSNLLFVPAGDCANTGLPQDQALAKLLRPLGDIDLTEPPSAMAVEIFGNLAVGGIEALLPGSAFARVSQLSWSGQVTSDSEKVGAGAGVKDFLAQATLGSAADPAKILTMVETIPLTGARMLEEISGPNDPAAIILRILSGNVTSAYLLPPDSLLGTDPIYKLPHSMLALLGKVRRKFTPADVTDFERDADWGYLKTIPLISRNASGQVEISGDFVASLNQMATDASALNVPGVISAGGGVVRKTLVAGADIARMGINGIAPLLDLDASGQQAVASIQQRAIFSDLAGDTPGFSGISGGLQREWEAGDSVLGDITVQMYGQLVWPFVGRQVGLMTLANQGNDVSLNFEMAAATEGLGDLFGGLTGELTATLAFGENEQGARELGLSYFATQKLEILSNTIGNAAVSGYINDLSMPQSGEQNLGQYAAQQAMQMDIGMCGSYESQILPFPLSLTGISATATVGSFAEKNDTDLSLGFRVGLSGSMKLPGFNSLLGLTLGGSVTQGYNVAITEGNLFPNATIQQCINPRITLTVGGQQFDLSGFDLRAEAFTEGNQILPIASGIKLRFALNSELLGAIKNALTCDSAINAINPFCNALKVMQNGSMWLVMRSQVIPALQQQIMVGIGQFPQAGQESEFPYIEGKMTLLGNVPVTTFSGISKTAGSWGGFKDNQGAEICARNLCNINEEIGL